MTSRDPGSDKARPIPQARAGRSEHVDRWNDDVGDESSFDADGASWDDDFVVDTRRRGKRFAAAGRSRAAQPTLAPAHHVPAREPVREPARPAARQAPSGPLYEEDADYVPGQARGRRTDPGPDARPNARPNASPDARPGARPGARPNVRPDDGRGYAGEPPTRGPRPPRRRSRARRRGIIAVILLVVLAWIAFMVWVPLNAWGNVTRVDDAPAGARPAATAGHNYLLVGSDGRDGLTPEQQKQLNASGGDIGKRTDSIILVHVSEHGGKPALISIPRDSYVPIPGYRSNKINASFAFGGAKLLVATVEQATGIRIDGYVEIGFGGFASVVDSLGGVDVCVPFDMNDAYAAINLKKGCQTLDGPTALGYVRARHSDPRGDIGRAERQRQFLGAILKKAVTPSTVLVPSSYKGFADAAAKGLEVGQDTQMTDAVRVLQTLRGVDGGDTLSLVVPIANAAYQTPNAGVAVKWNTTEALALFAMIKNDQPMTVAPAGTVPGS